MTKTIMKILSLLLVSVMLVSMLASCAGEPGIQGEQGPQGVQGEKGDKGDAGDMGMQGPQGVAGLPGVKGEKGDNGADGANGADGIVPHIGINGNWWIGETDTRVKAGGAEGNVPYIKDGFWYIDGKSTKIDAQGEDGVDGKTSFAVSNEAQLRAASRLENVRIILTKTIYTTDTYYPPNRSDFELDLNGNEIKKVESVETIVPVGNKQQDTAKVQEAIEKAEQGGLVSLPANTTINMPAFNGNNTSNAVDVTIAGSKDTVIDMSNAVAAGGSTITFDGLTVQTKDNASYVGIQHTEKVVYKDATILGQQFMYAPEVEFINCTFENFTNNYCVWTYGAKNVKFINCTFNTAGKAVLVYNETKDASFVANISFENCTFNDDNSITMTKAAVETGVVNLSNPSDNSSPAVETATSNKYNLTFTDCTVNGFAESPEGIKTNTKFFANKNSMNKDHLNVIIDGVDVY